MGKGLYRTDSVSMTWNLCTLSQHLTLRRFAEIFTVSITQFARTIKRATPVEEEDDAVAKVKSLRAGTKTVALRERLGNIIP